MQIDDRPAGGQRYLGDGPIALTIEVNLAVDPELGKEYPAAATSLEVAAGSHTNCRRPRTAAQEAAQLGHAEHRQEVIVLGEVVLGLVIDPVVAGEDAIAVGPGHRDQVDAPDDPAMLARPKAADEVHLLGVMLIEGRVVEHEQSAAEGHQGLHLAPGLLSNVVDGDDSGGVLDLDPIDELRPGDDGLKAG